MSLQVLPKLPSSLPLYTQTPGKMQPGERKKQFANASFSEMRPQICTYSQGGRIKVNSPNRGPTLGKHFNSSRRDLPHEKGDCGVVPGVKTFFKKIDEDGSVFSFHPNNAL